METYVFPASFAQRQLWLADQLEETHASYNLVVPIAVYGLLNPELLQRSINEIIRRHETLRTRFDVRQTELVQIVDEAFAIRLDQKEIVADSEEEALSVAMKALAKAGSAFDLRTGPLIRASLLKMSEREHLLVIVMHHIISDGWSVSILVKELAALYQAYCDRKESPLPELEIQYADYAEWQRNWLEGDVLERQIKYWRVQLDGAPPMIDLPIDFSRPPVQSYSGASQRIEIPNAVRDGLKRLSREEGATMFMTLLAAFNTLLYRYSGQKNIVIGTPIANRNRVEIEELIGYFANTLVMRTKLDGDPTFREVLRRVKDVAMGAYANQDVPFEKLVEELKPERDLSRPPFFHVVFTLQNEVIESIELPELVFEQLQIDSDTSKFDLTLTMQDGKNGLKATCKYNTDLYEQSTIRQMMTDLQKLLESIVEDPDQRIAEMLVLHEKEHRKLFAKWNYTRANSTEHQYVHQMFEAQAARTPDALAVVTEHDRITYAELNQRANQLAHYIRSLGITAEKMVAICIPPSIELVIGLVAILKAGGAFVPLDPAYPAERLSFMVDDAQATVLLTRSSIPTDFRSRSTTVVLIDSDWNDIARQPGLNPACEVLADHLAYIIYTSGSTGWPKGVAISHSALANLVDWHLEEYAPTESDRASQIAGISFDASVWEIWPYLTSGASIHIPDAETRLDIDRLLLWLNERSITLAFLPTPLAESSFDRDWPESTSLRALLTGGDRLRRYPGEAIPFQVVNHYGPTENTVVATYAPLTSGNNRRTAPPIGRPINNVTAYVLDRKMQPVPIGVKGELYLGGHSLARGYFRNPDLTASSFRPNPFSAEPGERLYKTGDMVRYLRDGDLEFLGRADDQVKIRGFRIELGEIEATLLQHPQVRESAVCTIDEEQGAKRLVAYVVCNTESLTKDELREFVRRKLPDYLTPASFVMIDKLPMTPNGKIDRRALAASYRKEKKAPGDFAAPRTPVEKALAEIWASALGVQSVGVNDDFFETGGHSLTAMQLVWRAREAFEVDLSLRSVFEEPTVSRFAHLITRLLSDKDNTQLDRIGRNAEQELLSRIDQLSDEEVDALLSEMQQTEHSTGS